MAACSVATEGNLPDTLEERIIVQCPQPSESPARDPPDRPFPSGRRMSSGHLLARLKDWCGSRFAVSLLPVVAVALGLELPAGLKGAVVLGS